MCRRERLNNTFTQYINAQPCLTRTGACTSILRGCYSNLTTGHPQTPTAGTAPHRPACLRVLCIWVTRVVVGHLINYHSILHSNLFEIPKINIIKTHTQHITAHVVSCDWFKQQYHFTSWVAIWIYECKRCVPVWQSHHFTVAQWSFV